MQIDVDIGSSTVANGVLGLVIGVITSLVVEMAFLVQVKINKTKTLIFKIVSPLEIFWMIPRLRFVGEYTRRIARAAYRGGEGFSYRAIIGYSS